MFKRIAIYRIIAASSACLYIHVTNTVKHADPAKIYNNITRLEWELSLIEEEKERILKQYIIHEENHPACSYYKQRYEEDISKLKFAIYDIKNWARLSFRNKLCRFPPNRLIYGKY